MSSPYTNKLRSTQKKKRQKQHASSSSSFAAAAAPAAPAAEASPSPGGRGARDPSGTRRELQASRHQFLLDRVFLFLSALFSHEEGAKAGAKGGAFGGAAGAAGFTESSFAAALPDGELLCRVAQCVSRRCALTKLAGMVWGKANTVALTPTFER